jgi:hypothetical protein
MRVFSTPSLRHRLLTAVTAAVVGFLSTAHAAVVSYTANLSGPNESPANASPGVGTAQVDIDATAHSMRVRVTFSGLLGTTTASHIHSPTAVALSGTAGVATTTPSFVGFPLGVTSGTYDLTYDTTLASSYNPAFVTANGGTPATAEAALFSGIANGFAYLNIHSTVYGGGEIRGFLVPLIVTPTTQLTWGRIKALYR